MSTYVSHAMCSVLRLSTCISHDLQHIFCPRAFHMICAACCICPRISHAAAVCGMLYCPRAFHMICAACYSCPRAFHVLCQHVVLVRVHFACCAACCTCPRISHAICGILYMPTTCISHASCGMPTEAKSQNKAKAKDTKEKTMAMNQKGSKA